MGGECLDVGCRLRANGDLLCTLLGEVDGAFDKVIEFFCDLEDVGSGGCL